MSGNPERGQHMEEGGATQYLVFALSGEEYGLEILKIQEIREWSPITPVPNVPRHLKGVMNLRGTILPVVDLRARFGMGAVTPGPSTVVIVARLGATVTGLMVDAVFDVLSIPARHVQASQELGLSASAAWITGVARVGERLVLLLDADRLVGAEAPVAVES
jgi:purine-binding chemotaxis protein CheW